MSATYPQLKLGFGATGAWGKAWFSAQKAKDLIAQALDLGIHYFDTAGFYTNGIAETRLGDAVKGRHDICISTKVGTRYVSSRRVEKDFSDAGIHADLIASFQRLNRDHIHVLYLHGPSIKQIDQTRQLMQDLKQEGKIAKIGVCGAGAELAYTVETGAADVIMGTYNAFDQSHGPIFEKAKAKNIQTIGIAPLGQALYRHGFTLPKSPSDVWYLARAIGKNRDEFRHARQHAAAQLANIAETSPASAMLNFALANASLDRVFINTTRREHLAESVRTARTLPLSSETLANIAKLERTRQSG
ncbi:MAG: aldo/keto reductase [Hyphomonadaceae bacterium]